MELTTSRGILFLCIIVICTGINPTTILNAGGSYDNILPGYGYDLLKVKTLEHCHRVCLYSPKCLSVNWNMKTRFCQLNSEDVGPGTPLMPSTGDVYVPALSPNIQNHACTPSPCRYGDVCIPVTATKGFVCLRPDIATNTSTASPTTDSTGAAAPTPAAATTTTTTTPTSTSTTTSTNGATTVTTTNTPPTTTISATATATATATTTTTTTTTTTSKPTSIITTTTPTTTTPATTQDLSGYSDSFRRIQGYVVWLLNNQSYYDVNSVSKCEQYCIQHTAFTCKSYEYYYAQEWCFLQSFVKDDALSAWTADSRGDYFQRLFKWEV
ncbi:uncharacterized protein [Haliotis cracherodii]|uniref:uncharacterized protein n=1 Tax=Haliotis cracherodii TaxID=6455 RepID=UPI0039EB52DF